MPDFLTRRLPLQPLALLVALGVPACAPFAGPARSPAPPEFTPSGNQTKCRVMKSQSRPLIVEWSSADRAALEVLAQRGTVAVRYLGCEMEVLPRCRAPGAYAYTATTRKTEQVTIRNDDELYASLPIGAAKLEGKLASHGQLDVTMNVVGQYGTDKTAINRSELEGDCGKATHVVTGLTVGAFEFTAGAGAEASGGGGALGVGAGGRTAWSKETLSSDGDVTACERATREDKQPPEGCGGLLRIEVEPIGEDGGGAGGVVGGPGCPAGTSMVNGTCQALQAVPSAPPQLMVQVSCGMDPTFVGTREGLRVWIDGEPATPSEEPRVFNPMSPGAQGPVQYVAFETTPGEHTIRMESEGCEARETTVKVKAGEPRPVMGRLQPTSLFSRAPAGAWSMGFAVQYSALGLASLEKDADYSYDVEKVSIDASSLTGFGGALSFETQHAFVEMGFGRVSGDGKYVHPSCSQSSSGSCPLAGTEGTIDVAAWQMPLLVGARIPLQYVSATAGAGFTWSILSIKHSSDSDLSVTSPMGAHVPVFVGLEARPLCPLGIGARYQRGFSLGSDVGSFDVLTLALAYHISMGCSADAFGIQ